MEELKLDGLTAKEWAEQQFEFEYCAKCGGDAEDHDIIPFMGHWFARCKQKTWKLKSPFHYIDKQGYELYIEETEEGKFEVTEWMAKGGYYETLSTHNTWEEAVKELEAFLKGES